MTIREVIRSDCQALRLVAKAAITSAVDAPEFEKPDLLEGVIRNIELVGSGQLNGVVLISELAGSPVGFILVKDDWNLSDLFVSPAHHGVGIGKSMWHAELALCEELSPKQTIRVNSSLNAVPFYESVGFYKIQLSRALSDFLVIQPLPT